MLYHIAAVISLLCLFTAGLPPPHYLKESFYDFDIPEQNKRSTQSDAKCGYASCDLGKEDMLNVHLIAHTHDDVGWLKTVDQYYYGYKNYIQHAGVQYILDTTIQELIRDPRRRFIYVEMAFFSRWWNEQEDNLRHVVKQLVNEGRLQFILGGWSMNDEATTHYTAIVDQHTRGMRFLKENFGECGRPLASWQIDPFGHSREQASLFAQMGFDSLFFFRLDSQEKDLRLNRKTMELLWRGSDDLKEKSDLFTSVMYDTYCPPAGFCFDQGCSDDPIMDDPTLFDMNVQQRVDDFLKYVKEQSKYYTSNHILVPMGCDFQFENAQVNFKNMDKLIKYVNARQVNGSRVNLLYSTPSCYTYAVNRLNLTYSWKVDDFFPYADSPHSYWTGYFVSRAALKGYVRDLNNRLQAAQQLAVLSGLENQPEIEQKIDTLRRAMGILQHHDAVSGTEKQHVTYDYAKRLSIGADNARDTMSIALNKLMYNSSGNDVKFYTCDLLNISRCSEYSEENQAFTMVAYNPLAWQDTRYIHLPIKCDTNWDISRLSQGDSESPVKAQIGPVSGRTQAIPERGNTPASCEIIFQTNTSALGFSTYVFQPSMRDVRRRNYTPINKVSSSDENIYIENDIIRIDFPSANSTTMIITNKRTAVTTTLDQSMRYYFGFQGDGRKSGAYIFRPEDGSIPQRFPNVQITGVLKGALVEEIHQTFDTWATQVIRMYRDEETIEVEWTVGPIPDDDGKGREIFLNYQTELVTFGLFYTDANGRQILMRQRDARPSVSEFVQTEPVAGNYYPINSRILISDVQEKNGFMVLTDRSQGGGSIRDGQIEIMVHRRTMKDDNYGVGEPLKEQGSDDKGLIVRGKHYLLLGSLAYIEKTHRIEATRIFHQPISLFTKETSLSLSSKVSEWSGVKKDLPQNVHLMTLDNWQGNTKLLRLEHLYESKEDANSSQPVTVVLNDLFSTFDIVDATELTLAGNQNLSESKRLIWNYGSTLSKKVDLKFNPRGKITVELSPMEIRTFQISTKP
jgi:lysosomal alpha-mannosidase